MCAPPLCQYLSVDGATRDVDVVVVSHNSQAVLEAAIRSVRAWDRTSKVVVVDNGSLDGSVSIAERLADETIVSTNIGFGGGQNLGVGQCRAEWVLLLNPDAVVDVGGLERGYQYASGQSAVAMVEGSIRRSADSGVERWCGSEPGLLALFARLSRLRERMGEERLKRAARWVGIADYADRDVIDPTRVEFLAAVAPLVRRSAFDQVGGFDDDIFLYAEDIDLCRRLREAEWSIVAIPWHWAEHVGAASSGGYEARRAVLWWQSHGVFVRKHWTGPRRWTGLLLTALGTWRARRSLNA